MSPIMPPSRPPHASPMMRRELMSAHMLSEMPVYWKYMVVNESAAPGIVPKMPWRMITENVGICMNLRSFRSSVVKPRRSGFQVG
eukprot:CAMPEP_0197924016 /NCGR_PEP_ID=MMETSP1439-20131203/94985_1 /TAXON_ID=66791 /ORGANISM="Gonyaulax spinifera, Strain CCMP409" /LENGTH=84 /DNA_ID=CAMNT_0043546417 /DNA_START=9 /DNA_END=259 /DNA_ORIENTATION=-